MKVFFKTNFPFLFPYLIFILSGILLIALNTKAEKHLEFNSFHNSFFDSFFYYFTFLGDGVSALIISLLIIAANLRDALFVGISNIISALITQLLKHTLFADIVRPKKFFEGMNDLYLVPGVDNYLYNSFPSGHSTCAFSLYFALSLIVRNKILKFIFFVIAFLVGYSRIYLSQHFFEDVYAGSIIGVSITLIVYYFIRKTSNNWTHQSII